MRDHAFPSEPFEALGYNVAVHGQKTFNGVALLSKFPFDEVTPRPARRPGRRPCAFHGAVVSTAAACCASPPLSAQRQSARD